MKRFLAWLLGYFYLPCVGCGRMFAGWECDISNGVALVNGHSYVLCGKCP